MTDKDLTFERRTFVTRLGVGIAAAATIATPSLACAQDTAQRAWKPERHPQDDWFDEVPGRHRFFWDTTTPDGVGEALAFATNYYVANRSGYNLSDRDLAVVICLRHFSTPFAWTDEMWAKYGEPIAGRIGFNDPKTLKPPTTNVYLSRDYGNDLPNRGVTLTALIERGAHFAVCDMATRAYAGVIARALNLSSDEVYKDVTTHSIANCHYVPAGIVAVARAQERGYAAIQMGV